MPISHPVAIKDYDGSTNNLTKFCRELVYYSQWKAARFLHSGSKMELPSQHIIAPVCGVKADKLDVDTMVYLINRVALSSSQPVPDAYIGGIVRIYSEGTHAGYVKLIQDKNNEEFTSSHIRLVGGGETIHGPAILKDVKKNRSELSNPAHKLSNTELNEAVHERLIITAGDLVYAIHSPYWPAQAAEWITRQRRRGFPSNCVLKQVVKYGCDFVPVSHKFGDLNEWRFSFSRAELLIIKSWTKWQDVIYQILWVINKKIDGMFVCSYYLKTLMLWANEEKPSDFWSDDNLDNSVHEILINLITCLKSKYCPNYFIPANNMMDHLIATDLAHDITALWKYLHSDISFIKLSVVMSLLLDRRDYELPACIKRAVVIYDAINNEEDNFVNLYRTKLASDFLNALHVELVDIFRSIRLQQEASKLEHGSSELINKLVISEKYLTHAIGLFELDERDTLLNCNHLTVRSIENAYMLVACEKRNTSRGNTFDLGSLFKSTNNVSFKMSRVNAYLQKGKTGSRCPKTSGKSLAASRRIEIFEYDFDEVKRHEDWPGKSPTVNIAWFIAKAYLANLYFVTKRDVSLILKTCDDVIAVSKLSYMNERHAERALLVVLSTDWAGIFDRHIQEMIGLYSLCVHVMTAGRNRSVYLGVCPVLFVMYIKLHVTLTLDSNEYQSAWQDYSDHSCKCKCDFKIKHNRRLILQAWCNCVLTELHRLLN